MRRSTKVLICILVILIICLISYIIYIMQDKPVSSTSIDNTILNNVESENITNEITNTVHTTNDINSQNAIEQNTTITEQVNNVDTNDNIIGKEEQESNEQSGGVNPDEKAIDLAKKEWGETAENYLFAVEDVNGNIYRIAVISNATTIGYIEVDIETGEAKEV